jgi:group I intron endonuclease
MYVYKITNKINNKIYIGITVRTVEERFLEHFYRRSERKHLHLYSSIIKYGFENFEVEQIDSAKNQKGLFEKEIYWIQYYNSTNPKIGYNNIQRHTFYKSVPNMEEILEYYKDNNISFTKLSEIYNIPRKRLSRLIKYKLKI